MDAQTEDRIVGKIIDHVNEQAKLLETSFNSSIDGAKMHLSTVMQSHEKKDVERFAAVHTFIKPVLETRTMRELRVVCISVIVALLAVGGAAWAMH